jgi:hypothetical protein
MFILVTHFGACSAFSTAYLNKTIEIKYIYGMKWMGWDGMEW